MLTTVALKARGALNLLNNEYLINVNISKPDEFLYT
jgi:hypothetical protein